MSARWTANFAAAYSIGEAGLCLLTGAFVWSSLMMMMMMNLYRPALST
jgi:hypothetical protein